MFRAKYRKPLKCCECKSCSKNERYYNILGDTYCRECTKEWIKDELLENFDDHMDDLAELVGVRVLGGFDFE